MSDKASLLAMGFDSERIDWALRATRNAGLQPAMDHLLNNAEKPIPEPDSDNEDDAQGQGLDGGPGEEARSIKCSTCGKTFRSQATASFHAERSGHQEFEESTEEIKPLTEEEKKAKLAELRAKLAEKRAVQSKDDEKAQRANEALRRKAGQDAGKIREDMQLKEALKEADRKKREKVEDARARAAIKAQIEADKRERAAKAAQEKALREGAGSSAAVSPTSASASGSIPSIPAAAKPNAPIASSENPETRLQIRLHVGGAPLVKTFPSDNTLIDVAEFVAGQSLSYDVETVTFASTFPRKTFSREEMKRTLKQNGLTPSAVLMAS